MKVIMLNRDWGYGIQTRMLQGFSGKSYGQSRWNAKYNCHTVELTLEQYDKCRDDVHRAVHLVCRRWYPVFEVPLPVREFAQGYQFGMDGAAEPINPCEAMGYKAAHEEAGWTEKMKAVVAEVLTDAIAELPPVDPSMPFMKLRSIAKAEGVWEDGMKNAAIAEAINTKRALSAPVVAPPEPPKKIIPVEETPDYKSGYMAAAQGFAPPGLDPKISNNWRMGFDAMSKKASRFQSPSARFSAPTHA